MSIHHTDIKIKNLDWRTCGRYIIWTIGRLSIGPCTGLDAHFRGLLLMHAMRMTIARRWADRYAANPLGALALVWLRSLFRCLVRR